VEGRRWASPGRASKHLARVISCGKNIGGNLEMLHAELIGVETPTWKLEEPSLQEPHEPHNISVHIIEGQQPYSSRTALQNQISKGIRLRSVIEMFFKLLECRDSAGYNVNLKKYYFYIFLDYF
jgi:hypothetical protein